MSAAMRKGACPTIQTPMASGDGLLVRVKPPGGRIAADAARAVANASGRCGNGVLELTNRANLQIRGLRVETVADFAAVVVTHGLAAAEPAVEIVRNVMTSPLGAADPSADADSHAMAEEIEALLAAEPRLRALPPKFGFLTDGGGAVPLTGVTADIGFRWIGGRLLVTLDGTTVAAMIAPDALTETARALAVAFLEFAGAGQRMLDVDAEAVYRAAGLATRPAPLLAPAPLPPVGIGSNYVGIGLPLGQIDAEILTALAGLADAFGDGWLRLTPWRTVIIAGVQHGEELAEAAVGLGLAAMDNDPRLGIAACVGGPACSSGTVPARRDAILLAAAGIAGVHVSGCAKGCALSRAAPITLVGNAGRYDVVRNGRAGDLPTERGLAIGRAIALLRPKVSA